MGHHFGASGAFFGALGARPKSKSAPRLQNDDKFRCQKSVVREWNFDSCWAFTIRIAKPLFTKKWLVSAQPKTILFGNIAFLYFPPEGAWKGPEEDTVVCYTSFAPKVFVLLAQLKTRGRPPRRDPGSPEGQKGARSKSLWTTLGIFVRVRGLCLGTLVS